MTVTAWVNIALSVLIIIISLQMIDRMTRETACGIRWGVVLVAAGAVLAILGYVWKWEDWADTVLLGGVATYFFANLREPLFISALKNPAWRKRGAYAIIGATIGSVVFFGWSASARSAEPAPQVQENRDAAEIKRAVDKLIQIYEFCHTQPCVVLPRIHYDAIQRDMGELRERLWELEKPRPSQAGCA